MITNILSAVILVSYLLYFAERRTGTVAKNWKPGKDDKNSTISNALAMFFLVITSLIYRLFEEILPRLPYGDYDSSGLFGFVMLVVMVVGCGLRLWSMITLGKFFTRTLAVQADQKVVTNGPYALIRHPGYLANFFVMFPFCLIIASNWILFTIVGLVYTRAYVYRIRTEEQMLLKTLGTAYQRYSQSTWKLIPYVF